MARKVSSRMPEHFAVSLGVLGRLVLPARLRQRLNLRDGERMVLTVERDSSIRLRTVSEVVNSCRGMYKHLLPPGVSLADDLIRQRREEARRENER